MTLTLSALIAALCIGCLIGILFGFFWGYWNGDRHARLDTVRVVKPTSYYASTIPDGGGGPDRTLSAVAAPGTYVHNGGSIIVPTGGDGSQAWVGPLGHQWTVKEFGAKVDGTDAAP